MAEKLVMGGGAVPQRVGTPVASPALDTTTQYDRIGSIDSVRREIDDAFDDMRDFYNQEPDDVMRSVAGHLARLAELSKEIRRVEKTRHRHLKPIRTDELDPAMKDLWDQYQIASRLLEARKIDYAIAGAHT